MNMTRFNFTLLLAFFVSGSHAFVARPTFVLEKIQQPSLMAVDLTHVLDTASMFLAETTKVPDFIPGTSGEVTYSRASYYTILGLYLTSFPGLWSTIKRSTSAKVKRKTFVT